MKDHYDFSKGRKNPYAEKLKKEGYTISIQYSPQDIAEMANCETLPEAMEPEKYHATKETHV